MTGVNFDENRGSRAERRLLRARRERIPDSMRKNPTLSFQNHALLGALLCVAFVMPEVASAQTSLVINVQGFGGRNVPVLLAGPNGRPISRQECEDNDSIPIQLTNLPYSMAETRFISVWRGAPTSGACNTPSNRELRGGTVANCTFIDSFQITSTMMDVSLDAGDAFDNSCDTTNSFEYWFLVVPSSEDRTTNVTSFSSLRIDIDPTPPEAPTDLQPGAGDRQIQISWSNPTSATDANSVKVYVDVAGCNEDGEVIADGVLTAGAAPPEGIEPRTFGAVRTAQLDGEALGLSIGNYAAVAVTLVDRASNESVLSNVVCIQRVEVSGFWDAYCSTREGDGGVDGGMSPEVCRQTTSCAVQPGTRGSLTGVALVCGAMFIMISRRRKNGRAQ